MPLRPKQHVSESTSIKVVERSLPKEWILRTQRENDYGIDCEIELVMPDGQVTGRFLKAQIKGKDTVSFDDEGRAYVGGIKQSTLRYWIEISRSAPVIAILTSNSEERVFFVPTFWQATRLLDGADSEKRLCFQRELELTKQHGDVLFLLMFFRSPHEQIKSHKLLLGKLPRYLYEYLDLCHYDPWMINFDVTLFKEFLEHGQTLRKPLSHEEREVFDYYYWVQTSEKHWNDSIMNAVASEAYNKVLSILLPIFKEFREHVIGAAAYWKSTDPEYYDLVEAAKIPDSLDPDFLYRWLRDNGMHDERFF